MNNCARDEDLYLRMVFGKDKKPNFWKTDGSLSSAAFKDPAGLSVDHATNNNLEDVKASMRRRLSGLIYAVTGTDCDNKGIICKKIPLTDDPWHYLLIRSEEKLELSASQAKHLARVAKPV